MSASPAQVTAQPPSAVEVELTAREMGEIREKLAAIRESAERDAKPLLDRLAKLQVRSIEWLRSYGSAHAEKSKLLHGLTLEIMGTFGQCTSIDAAAVEMFRIALMAAKKTRLLKKIFEKTERWSLASNAGEIIRSVKLPDDLLALYSKCTVTSSRTPTLTVRPKKKPATAS